MKRIGAALIGLAMLASPMVGHAQGRGGGGGHGGGWGGGGGSWGGGWRGGGPSGSGGPGASGAQADIAGGPGGGARWSGGPRAAAPALGGYARGPGGRGYPRYRYGYPRYGVDYGFALGFSLAYPWYADPFWGYGFYGPAYAWGPYGPSSYWAPAYYDGPVGPPPAYDDPFARDYGTVGPAQPTNPDGTACGNWVWDGAAQKYNWQSGACRSPASEAAAAPAGG